MRRAARENSTISLGVLLNGSASEPLTIFVRICYFCTISVHFAKSFQFVHGFGEALRQRTKSYYNLKKTR
jgi:hypothetical protein